MTAPPGFNLARIDKRTDWTSELFSLRVTGAPLDFKAGQFTKLAMYDDAGQLISRAYSIVNAPLNDSDMLEFLVVANPQGKLTPKLHCLEEGSQIYVGSTAHGDLVLSSIPKSTQDLWLLSTGTGIGPFLSLLDDINLRLGYKKIVLAHGVRHEKDLVYRYLIDQLVGQYEGRLCYLPIVSREESSFALKGRIPTLLEEGQLQTAVKAQLTKENSFVMLCGNPDMIKETTQTLQAMGLEKFRRATGGNITFERYW
ncbi:ferredoxin--NADP(+) reductase [Vibrio zhanjiangensis]|uniref:ferredoxin--NADP(+) reductase n=1 Tax=Vibrio zhanjiangensis TaxID=1046128 RepID=A0ABQ6F0P0_9VIBR|nr:ferredoxin--NADP reductase [Vibrio zhanjiangensis]GLT18816.1 ferredoxin--NADP(+) reductase [Vibrio zhanjiangensis]